VLLALIALPGFTDGQAPAPQDPARAANTTEVKKELPANAAQPAAKPAVDEREQRLQRLEANLEALLKEVKDLRNAAGKNPPAHKTAPANPTTGNPYQAGNTPQFYQVQSYPAANAYYESVVKSGAAPAGGQSIHLERVTYALPKEKAEALAALLKDLKAPVLETQVKPDSIVVTTSPAAQRVVGEFVGLLQGKMPQAQYWNSPLTAPKPPAGK
jgi:hypothetical protein